MSNLDKRIRKVTYETLQEFIKGMYEVVEDKEFLIHFPEFSHIVGKLYERVEEMYIDESIDMFTLFNHFDDITYSITEMVTNGESEYFKDCVNYLGLDEVKFSYIIDNSENLWEHITLNDIMYIKTTHLKRMYKDNNIAYNTILD